MNHVTLDDQYNQKVSKLESFQWKIERFFKDIYYTIKGIPQGLRNFWYWKNVIYQNRWWDHQFLINLIQHQLEYMDNQWHKGNHMYKEEEQEIIKKSLRLLEEIENYDNSNKNVSMKYQEFGRHLFDQTENPRDHSSCSNIERLWD